MTADLAAIFGSLLRYHIATPDEPIPAASTGITWIWAANGIFKRGVNQHLDALILHTPFPRPIPGLVPLEPHAIWRTYPSRIPGAVLEVVLRSALNASIEQGGIARPIEEQYHIIYGTSWPDASPHIAVYRAPQHAGVGYVQYRMPKGDILIDVHSHHEMPAFFSRTDDRDDAGLGISAVIGKIFTAPEIITRINVHGDHMVVPALAIFDQIAPFIDVGGAHVSIPAVFEN
jgi:hypothetical protein